MRGMLRGAAAIVVLGAAGVAVAGQVYRVDGQAGPGGDGLAWESAFNDLNVAINAAAAGDELWIREGTYTPADAASSFVLKSGVSLYGGFAGTETARNQRDWEARPTILSGDVGQDDEVGSGLFWYVNWNIHTANCGHVLTGTNLSPSTTLDGLIIADGHTGPEGTPAGHHFMVGSGLYLIGASPTVRNCTFTHNLCAFASGGAVYMLDSSPSFTDCLFLENYAHGGYGAGIFDYGASAPAVRGTTFRYNIAVATGPDAGGAGFAHRASTDITAERCVFDQNTARAFFGVGSNIGYGGGLFNWDGHMTVDRCEFTGNQAHIGGGFITWGPATIVDSLFVSNRAVPQPNDPYPEIGGLGAALAGNDAQASETRLINCTVAKNAGKKYAVWGGWNSTILGSNTVIYANTATAPEVIGGYRVHIGGSFELAWCCVQSIFDPPEPGEDPIDPENLPGCIDDDPVFVAPLSGDFRLSASSPCIDAGSNNAVPGWVSMDLDGNARFYDDPATPDTGQGVPPIVDMGAYEFGAATPEPCPGDLDGDMDVDSTDLNILLSAFGCTGGGCPGDADGDGDTDTTDLNIVLSAFGTVCG